MLTLVVLGLQDFRDITLRGYEAVKKSRGGVSGYLYLKDFFID